ncbi:piwi-like protein 4 isoform X1 [Scyliorhinus canicula]|uniref:piwi-like protein 4 isoform X1 n=2 Tax=Scyliorhinus canicula TaxID=7830 RepID=UPI0018F33ACC|nr:piwi-like protein 4 isoform X1 [Scyliorhinus canicula]
MTGREQASLYEGSNVLAVNPSTSSLTQMENVGNSRIQRKSEACSLTVSAGFERQIMMERGRSRRRNFFDFGVNTRKTMEHVQDSKSGSSGIPVKIVTNLFAFRSPPKWCLNQYQVTFMPDIESKRLRMALLFSHSDLLGSVRAFDGAMLFLPNKLQNKVTKVTSMMKNGQIVNIVITLTSEFPQDSPMCIQFFNITIKKVLKMLSMYQIGRNFYNPSTPIQIPQHRLTLWPGFSTSILRYETKILLSVDVTHKVLRSETVLDFMTELYNRIGDQRFIDTCMRELVGFIVLTRYNNKTYRIDDIDWSVKPTNAFKKADGTEITYIDYYSQQYDASITDLNQPMLVSQLKSKNDVKDVAPRVAHLIPEFCFLTGLSNQARSDFRIMKDLAAETQLTPQKRQQRLHDLIDNIQRNKVARTELEGWGLRLDEQISLVGRVLPTEKIHMFEHSCQPVSPVDWSRDIRNARIIGSRPLQDWLIVFSQRNYESAGKLLACLKKVGPPMGFTVENPKMVQVNESPTSIIQALRQHIEPSTQLVLCILPSNQKGSYDCIKKFLCVEKPIPSQCVVARTLNRANMMSIVTKIALQMACKIGGELWMVDIPLKSLMVIGIDINRDTLRKGTYVGFVASINTTITKWLSRCIFQPSSVEVADCLKVCMRGALNKWLEVNHVLPGRIVVYRDGVGDGQLMTLVDYEVPQILDSFKMVNPDYSPKVTIIVVRKKSTCRFFADMNGMLQNPPIGTVIDNEATRPEWYDFFLISQCARQGTVSPTYYNVVYDNSSMKPDHVQRLTYKICHLYYNWQGVIRVPAPCQYAFKLTTLVAQNVHREPDLELADCLFFL